MQTVKSSRRHSCLVRHLQSALFDPYCLGHGSKALLGQMRAEARRRHARLQRKSCDVMALQFGRQ